MKCEFLKKSSCVLLGLLLLLVPSLPIYSEGVHLTEQEYQEITTLLNELQAELNEAENELKQQQSTIDELDNELLIVETRLDESRKYFTGLVNVNESLEFWNNILIGVAAAAVTTTGLVLWLR